MMPMLDSVVFPFLKVECAFFEIWECSRNFFWNNGLLGELFSCNVVGQLSYGGNYNHYIDKEFHCYELFVKLECWLKDDQHQEELIIQQNLIFIDNFFFLKVQKAKEVLWS